MSRSRIACAAGVCASPVPKNAAASFTDMASTSAMFAPAKLVLQHRRLKPLALALLAGRGDARHHRQVGVDDAGAVAGRAAPSELALNSAGLTPFAFANALRIGSSSPV